MQEPRLVDWLEALYEGRWLAAGVLAAVLGAAAAYLFLATPLYQSDALVQVEEKSRGLGVLEELGPLVGGQLPSEAEIEILRSRTLLGSVVDDLRLDIDVRPRTLPLVGHAIARRHDGKGLASPFLGLSGFAWGGERLEFERLEVPQELEGLPLRLWAAREGTYELRGPDGELLVAGQPGKPAEGPRGRAFVSRLEARPGTGFTVVKLSRIKAVERLQRNLAVAERGRRTGVIGVGLEGPDPVRIAATLDAVVRSYLRQNVERRSAQAEKTLEFITEKLPQLRGTLEAAESALKGYRARRGGAVDLSLEARSAMERETELEKTITQTELQRADLSQRFTTSHPSMVATEQKLARLKAERASLESQFRQLPESELQSARLLRDVKVANELYLLLLNKAEELKVVKSGTIGNVRILDAAFVPVEPAGPRAGGVLPLALVLGLLLGVGAAMGRAALREGIDDPETLEREAGLPVYASIPHSDPQEALVRVAGEGTVPLLAEVRPDDLAIEALRSLRTSLLFALAEARNNVVAVGGPGPSLGKSFVCANLARLLAEGGTRVVVVDADLRRGHLHSYLGGGKAPGLSDVVAGTADLKRVVRSTTTPNLSFLSCGQQATNPADMLGSRRYVEIVEALSRDHDLVLVDTAPVLAVTDGALAARPAGLALLVLRAGKHPLREVVLAVKRLAQGGVATKALVLNDVRPKMPGRTAGHYQYEYARTTKGQGR